MTHGSSPDGDVGTLDLINNELTARLARQTDAGKGIDTKAGILATFAAVAAQFLATRHTQPVLAVIAYVAYAVAFGLAVWGLAVTDLKDVPKPRHLVEMYAREEKDKVLRPLIVKRVDGLESNQRMYKAKAKRWQYSLVALAVGVALSVLAMVHTEDRAQEAWTTTANARRKRQQDAHRQRNPNPEHQPESNTQLSPLVRRSAPGMTASWLPTTIPD